MQKQLNEMSPAASANIKTKSPFRDFVIYMDPAHACQAVKHIAVKLAQKHYHLVHPFIASLQNGITVET